MMILASVDLTSALIAAVASLATVVGVLFKWGVRLQKDLKDQSKSYREAFLESERDHGSELEQKALGYARQLEKFAKKLEKKNDEFVTLLKQLAEIEFDE